MPELSLIAANARGLAIAFIIGLAASFLSEHYGAPAMLFALLLGMALNFIAEDERAAPGIAFSARTLLRFGVALLGFRVVLGDILALGSRPIVLLVVAVVTTIAFGIVLARTSGLSKSFGALSGGAVAICGASAALAIAAILPRSDQQERETALVVVSVTALSTLAMIGYPLLGAAVNLSELQAGVFIGATIHDVAQVVGAGYSISDQAGDTATLFKLMRVAMLLPIVIVLGLLFRSPVKDADGTAELSRPPLLPGFLAAFLLIAVLNSTVTLPTSLLDTMNDLSRQCLITAIAAIGLKIDLQSFLALGRMPVLILVGETIWLTAFVLACLLLLR